jgi:tripartite ATP-independent transporter DctM subunit
MITFIVLGLFALLFLLRVPVAVSMLMVSLISLVAVVDVPLVVIPQYIVAACNKFEFLAIPFFILAAELMNSTGMTARIFRFATMLTGWIRGGLAQVTIVASVIFAGISGTAVADAAGLGRVVVSTMKKAGYDLKFSAGLTIATCIIGPLIPPSVVGVIYAVTAEVSVGRMLLAGAGPGFLLAAALMIIVYWMARTGRFYCPDVPRPTRAEFWHAFWDGLPAVLTPFIILFGIVAGVITPTEAGVASCVYALLVSGLYYRNLTWANLKEAFVRSTLASAMIMMIIAAASVMSFIITREQAAVELLRWMSGLTGQLWLQLLLINVFLLIVGCLIEGIPAMLILIPVMLPAVTKLGLDPIHFGWIMIFNLLIGIITPPMGVGLFILSNITGLTVEDVFKGCIPFILPLLACLLLITYVPQVSLFLPNLLLPVR